LQKRFLIHSRLLATKIKRIGGWNKIKTNKKNAWREDNSLALSSGEEEDEEGSLVL
jgi:hypothetical protein